MVATIFANGQKPHRVAPRPHQQQAQTHRQRVKDLLPNRTVGYSPDLARAVGGATIGLFLSQLLFLSDKGANPDGWVYKSEAEMSRETGLTKREQQTARRKLLTLGVIAIERRGFKFTYHFRIVWERLEQVIAQSLREQTAATEPVEAAQNVLAEPAQTVVTTPPEWTQNAPSERTQNIVTQDRDNEQRDKDTEKTNRGMHLTWELTLQRLKEQVPAATYETQLKDTRLLEVTEQTAKIAVPSTFAINWLERRLYGHMWKAISSILGREVDLQFIAAA